jgi:hypothetical protein
MATQTWAPVSLKNSDSQTLILRGERLFRQSLGFYSASQDIVRRCRERSAASRSRLRERHTHWASALGPIIRQKLRTSRLPLTRPAKIFGGPGAGGRCGARNRELCATQLVMTLLFDGRVLLLHGDCFIVWDAERTATERRIRTASEQNGHVRDRVSRFL